MSTDALNWAFVQDSVPSSARFVLVVLADYADQAHSAFPSVGRIMSRTGYSRSGVQKGLRQLEEAGLIRTVSRERPNGSSTTPRYYLSAPGAEIDDAAEEGHTQSAGGADSVGPPRLHSGPPEEPSLYPSLEPTPVSPSDELFNAIWSVWPKKVAESTARNEWKKIPASERQERCAQLITHGKAHAQYTPSEYWPRLSAYIRDTRWNEPLPTPRPGTPAAAGVTSPGLTDSQGRSAPYGLTPGGRRLGPPARAGEHPRAPWLGMMLSASSRGTVFVRDRPLQMREATENEKRILNGADD